MTTAKRVLLSWSSGKDSAWALHVLRQDPTVEVAALLTTFNAAVDRVAMHAVRRALVHAQAAAAGVPLWEVFIPSPCPNEIYEARMRDAMARASAEGFTHVAFGDLFLEDVRRYRETRLAGTGLAPIFPVWGIPTPALAKTMVASGVDAVITCVDPEAARPVVRRPPVRRVAAGGSAGKRRSVRRARRVPHVLLRGADVRAADRRRCRRDASARRLRLHRRRSTSRRSRSPTRARTRARRPMTRARRRRRASASPPA